jgi:hypothetical protein
MAKFVQKDVYIAVGGTVGAGTISGGTAISNYANKCEITDEADKVEFTGFSANAYKEYGPGLKDASINVTLFNDFASTAAQGAPYALLQPVYASGGTFGIEIRPTSAARSTSNPGMVMTVRMYSFSPLQGGIGDASAFDCSFSNASSTGLQYLTS